MSQNNNAQNGGQNNTSATETVLNYVLDIPSKIYVKSVILFALAIAAVLLTKVAVRQYSPVVHKINVGGANWQTADILYMDAGLFMYDNDDKNSSPQQYAHFFGLTRQSPEIKSVPEEVTSALPGDYTHYTKTEFSTSGNNFKIDVPTGKWTDMNNKVSVQGAARYSMSNDGHTITLENYSNSASNNFEVFIKGKDIFSDISQSNPYIAFNFTFDHIQLSQNGQGWLNFYYSKDETDKDYSKHLSAPLRIVSVYPEPDIVTPDMICFQEKMDVILQNGLFIILEDLSMKRRNDREMFLSSVFLGVVVSFLVQIIISLIRDIRDEKRSRRLRSC